MNNLKLYNRPMMIIEYLTSETWEGVPLDQNGVCQDGAYKLFDELYAGDDESELYGAILEKLIDGADKNNTFHFTLPTGENVKCYIENYENY